jgi:hypothetical protein
MVFAEFLKCININLSPPLVLSHLAGRDSNPDSLCPMVPGMETRPSKP